MVYEWLEFVEDLPENCHYADEGCDLFYSCLNCPFPKCILDLPPGKQFVIKEWRETEIIRYANSGYSVQDITLAFHAGKTTIYRILNRHKINAAR